MRKGVRAMSVIYLSLKINLFTIRSRLLGNPDE